MAVRSDAVAGTRAAWGRWSLTVRAVAIGVAGTLALIVTDAFVRDAAHTRGDDLIYEHMAQHPLVHHTFPFAYRFLVPLVVHVLPFGHTFSFSAIAWLASGAAGGAAYALLRRIETPDWLA